MSSWYACFVVTRQDEDKKKHRFQWPMSLIINIFPGRTSTFENRRWDDKQAMGCQLENKITRIFHASVQTLYHGFHTVEPVLVPGTWTSNFLVCMDDQYSDSCHLNVWEFLFNSYKELRSLSLGMSPIFVDPHSQYNSHFHCVYSHGLFPGLWQHVNMTCLSSVYHRTSAQFLGHLVLNSDCLFWFDYFSGVKNNT